MIFPYQCTCRQFPKLSHYLMLPLEMHPYCHVLQVASQLLCHVSALGSHCSSKYYCFQETGLPCPFHGQSLCCLRIQIHHSFREHHPICWKYLHKHIHLSRNLHNNHVCPA
ncbi:hypothetical protein V6Z11_1Z005800 [Gossypium hirsutum]